MNSIFAAWLLLAISIVSEVVGTVALKQSNGFAKFVPAVCAGFCYVLAVWLMSVSMKQLEMGITYAVWAGGGAALTALVGIVIYDESANLFKLIGVALVVVAVVVLNLGSK